MGDCMKVYHIPGKPLCPIRIQMSDDELVAALQVRDEQGCAFYWLLTRPETARQIIQEHGMTVAYTLPDTPKGQIT
jgi:hypothetical protein